MLMSNPQRMLQQHLQFGWPMLLGVIVMFGPVFHALLTGDGVWTGEANAHGPIILVLSLWLIVRNWGQMTLVAQASSSGHYWGWFVFIVGLVMYVLGRSQDIQVLEVGSFVPVTLGLLWANWGNAVIRVQWFPFFFMIFMVPLPGSFVGELTLPLKMAASYVSEAILYWLGYPIARSGVILQIAQYKLLVADACAGLQTLLTLEALGLFYLNVVKHTSALRNITLAILIIPISFIANVMRVIAIILVTYYFGDEAGQGFLHGFAGLFLFMCALVLIIGVDGALQRLVDWREARLKGRQ